MNIYKRILIYIKRNCKKSFLLGMVIFILGNLLITSFYITHVTNHIEKSITSELGALVSVHLKDVDSYYNNYDLFKEEFVNTIINEKDEYVSELNVASILSSLASDDLSPRNSDGTYYVDKTYGLYIHYQALAVNNSNFADYKFDNITITEGRTFTEEEIKNSESVVLINERNYHASNTCAYLNNSNDCHRETKKIEVGDTIEFSRIIDDGLNNKLHIENEEYKVIGLFKENSYKFENEFITLEEKQHTPWYDLIIPMGRAQFEYNCIEEMRDTLALSNLLNEESKDMYFSGIALQVESILYKYDNPEKVNEFSDKLEENLNHKYKNLIEVKTSKDEYDKVAAPLSGLNKISKITLIGAALVSVLVLTFVVILIFRDRTKEIGIYVALGEKRKNIILQFMLEIYFIGILSIGLSIVSGSVLGNVICDNVMETQIAKQEEIIDNNDKLYTEYDFERFEDFNKIGLSVNNILVIFIVESIVIILSSSYSILRFLKINPKVILQ